MDTKVIIDKESKKQLSSNLIDYNKKYGEIHKKLIFNVIHSKIDIESFPTDIINIIQEYCNDQIYFDYNISSGNEVFHSIGVHIESVAKINFTFYFMHISLHIDKRNEYIIVHLNYDMDDIIKKCHVTHAVYTYSNINLCAIINHYIKEKYTINNYIPYIINNIPTIISKGNNEYRCILAQYNIFSVWNIKIVNEHLFEIVISIVNELLSCLVEYVNN